MKAQTQLYEIAGTKVLEFFNDDVKTETETNFIDSSNFMTDVKDEIIEAESENDIFEQDNELKENLNLHDANVEKRKLSGRVG